MSISLFHDILIPYHITLYDVSYDIMYDTSDDIWYDMSYGMVSRKVHMQIMVYHTTYHTMRHMLWYIVPLPRYIVVYSDIVLLPGEYHGIVHHIILILGLLTANLASEQIRQQTPLPWVGVS